jgi:hypothetical protein
LLATATSSLGESLHGITERTAIIRECLLAEPP